MLFLLRIFVIVVVLVEFSCIQGDSNFKSKEKFGKQLSDISLGHASSKTARGKRQVIEYQTPAPYQYNVIYVIDSSFSLSNVDFKIALKAIELLTQKARQDTKYAAILFASYVQVISTFTSSQGILEKLKSTHRLRGGTNIYDALNTCKNLFNNPGSGLNPKALNRIVIITDGLYNIKESKTLSLAMELKLNNTEIFVVAIGRYMYGLTEISFLASSQDSHIFRVKTMKGLFDVAKWVPYDNDDNNNYGNDDSTGL